MSTMSDYERMRLVILGGQGVGKSCITKRFLFNTYCNKYKSTIEDLHNKEYDLGHMTLKVDILDTAGDMQFPAMRRLRIATAHAFLLVYSVTSLPSFDCIKQLFEEIREQRKDFQDIPIVVAGNKLDLATTHREITIEDVSEWVYCELPKLRVKILECSAKDDINIKDIFRSFLNLSKLIPKNGDQIDSSNSGLRRRSSAYLSASSKNRRRDESPLPEKSSSASGGISSSGGGSSSGCGGCSTDRSDSSGNFLTAKPRSRSLIRRASRKTKQQIRDAQTDECIVS